MNRYDIALGKVPPKPFYPEKHYPSEDFDGRLRMIVTGANGSGKTSYLLKDLKTFYKKEPRSVIFCSINDCTQQLLWDTDLDQPARQDFARIKFVKTFQEQECRGSSALYIDDADSIQFPRLKSIINYCSTIAFNTPRIILSCSTDNYMELILGENVMAFNETYQPECVNLKNIVWRVIYLSQVQL